MWDCAALWRHGWFLELAAQCCTELAAACDLCCPPPCRDVLGDARENPMVRHEAAEALGAIAAPECLELLRQVLMRVLE